MTESIRRVTSTLFILATLVAGITLITGSAVNCPVGTSCLGAVFSFSETSETIPLNINETTDSVADTAHGVSDFFLINSIIQSVSIYLLMTAAVVLIVLEIKELHYLKELSLRRRKKS